MPKFEEVQNFKTWGEARDYCVKYGLDVKGNTDVFTFANALIRAFLDGCRHQAEIDKGKLPGKMDQFNKLLTEASPVRWCCEAETEKAAEWEMKRAKIILGGESDG